MAGVANSAPKVMADKGRELKVDFFWRGCDGERVMLHGIKDQMMYMYLLDVRLGLVDHHLANGTILFRSEVFHDAAVANCKWEHRKEGVEKCI